MTVDQKIARLEGAYEHLATKADLAELKAGLAELKGQVRILIVSMTAVLAILNILLRFVK